MYRRAKGQLVQGRNGTAGEAAYQGSRREQSHCSMVDDELVA